MRIATFIKEGKLTNIFSAVMKFQQKDKQVKELIRIRSQECSVTCTLTLAQSTLIPKYLLRQNYQNILTQIV